MSDGNVRNRDDDDDDEDINLAPARAKTGRRMYRFVKRAFDIVASTLVIILLSWLYLIIALVVKCSDGGKVFYKHKRIGKDGKEFTLLKFRSMKENADDLEKVLTPEQYEEYMREFKVTNDPRITKVGKFLRKTSLDELPNIFSVWKGDLSVVGPRPLLKKEAYDKYGALVDKLLSVKPGLTGWWAVNGRNNVTYDSGERQKLELYYVDHRSVGLDLKIICKSVVGVAERDGAK